MASSALNERIYYNIAVFHLQLVPEKVAMLQCCHSLKMISHNNKNTFNTGFFFIAHSQDPSTVQFFRVKIFVVIESLACKSLATAISYFGNGARFCWYCLSLLLCCFTLLHFPLLYCLRHQVKLINFLSWNLCHPLTSLWIWWCSTIILLYFPLNIYIHLQHFIKPYVRL